MKTLLRILAWLLLGLLAFFSAITVYSYRLLPPQRRKSLDGITTLNDAVAACRASGKSGWALVAYAQQLTARKFEYSRRNHWDSPARAFERGLGYCQQQALALKQIYDHLGICSWLVYARQVRVPSKVVHGIAEPPGVGGHAWLQVQIGEEIRDVCPGSANNTPGRIHFQPLTPVRRLSPGLAPITHLSSVVVNFLRDVRAQRSAGQQE